MSNLPIFITGNQNKADYLSRQLGIVLDHRKIDLLEIQSTDLHEIVTHKLEQAYDTCKQPVLVEDVSLEFKALNGLPGPFIKWFNDLTGNEAMCRMLDGFDDRTATIRTSFGYYNGVSMEFFDSEYAGTISTMPRGSNGFGFDQIFICDGYDVTRAEMTIDENERNYADIKPFSLVKAFLESIS